ncbi:succinate dehydrogenase, hydrophobic membrane anchor protein [Candidatus Liberibacter africanus]|uniref:Succinate dehydrogenase hydrophobic membrane anchor subunit n=1 Tax=Candidatus Liberibacter africanus PTSAPSY TaxID=1277257 RepID=A0A0G3I3V4_LIBAF|nr:succinate dehydrogenase, hydrophobic membrane anchor protein [Candidatus Liberibacter africanus]AKK20561.1 succinate dehydrogenase hydrophobic membrane anchor [Candidatus Liberibacter africanus PTSAPSY]QTP64260.1 succinate dehydrogenase, hydrophobic membrane anchor protein [Candidatus Liberibacter africanus]
MRSGLGKVRGMGSAKDGTGHFLKQRFTAVANIPFIVFFIVFFVKNGNSSYENIVSVISNVFIASFMGLGIISIAVHMQLGMQVIIEDYIHSRPLKVMFLFMNSFFVFFLIAFSLVSILKIAVLGNTL